ncbi:MAG: protein translocase subunit SecF [gamma proteobacterium symbiont of Bathyaustriella thionipta]|nr:protein translocase subunit SecF [gamma proteobacterium symbiont of Bathyaustriella thionipta]MCU7950022.1 protein translocase subunit SecF [gamma proteobacterium symbiont of Bathyaustriella thionipta]MCU7952871.1 protein translocase subunit SecF [gamma proteobacterium symbiont of Bathyaustriella thionipta]MCU7956612.1 protein translocase subunit SecF [gamma proteobacterium symbiont of Bathyaustriella thionipta]MCU7968999.1 protein translocase subunit SecF [gamma proteobacterium symbiont of 
MQILTNTQIKFMNHRKMAMMLSAAFIVISIASLAIRGLQFGLDFTGGTLLEVAYPKAVELKPIREQLHSNGFGDAVVQHFGASNEVLVRVAPKEGVSNADISTEIFDLLRAENADVENRRVEFVGPQVGEELTETGGIAMLAALVCILIYVALRFEYRFALGSVTALAHDVIIVLGLFSVFGIEFDLTVLAAVLAVIGYSLNDTIVVFDRIRENFRKIRKGDAIEVIDSSLNQTLSRTLITSLTTLLVLVALFMLGGELIHGFATALLAGVFVGTYSSVYVASSVLVSMGISKEDLAPVKREGEQEEEIYEEV